MPTLYPRSLLQSDEDVVLDVRPHWSYLVEPGSGLVVSVIVLVMMVLAGAPSVVGYLAAVGVLACMGWFLVKYAQWRTTDIVLTSERLIYRKGLVLNEAIVFPLGRIGSVEVTQSGVQKLLGYGDVAVTVSPVGLTVTHVSEPSWFQRELSDALRRHDHRARYQGDDEAGPDDAALLDMIRRVEAFQRSQRASRSPGGQTSGRPRSRPRWDVFVSYASEDKAEVASPLAHELRRFGLKVWFDEFELHIGSRLRGNIDRGLAGSRFGVVVLSHDFFSKGWPQYELDGLVTREAGRAHRNGDDQLLLPIWHRITLDEVVDYSPSLAGRVARSTSDRTIRQIAEEIANLVGRRKRGNPSSSPPPPPAIGGR